MYKKKLDKEEMDRLAAADQSERTVVKVDFPRSVSADVLTQYNTNKKSV